jgi:hypothetical protein
VLAVVDLVPIATGVLFADEAVWDLLMEVETTVVLSFFTELVDRSFRFVTS